MSSTPIYFRCPPSVKKDLEAALVESENVSSFILAAVKKEIAARKSMPPGLLGVKAALKMARDLATGLELLATGSTKTGDSPLKPARLHNGRTKEDLRIHVISAGVRPLDNRICDVVGNDGAAWLLSCLGTYRELCLKNPYSWPTFRELVDAHPNGHDVFKRWPELRGMYEEDAAAEM